MARYAVWAFANVMPGARMELHCDVCDHTYVEGGVVVGDRVTIKSGVFLWEGMVVEDDVFLGPQAAFTNDRFPRSRRPWTCEGIRSAAGQASARARWYSGRVTMVSARWSEPARW